jgi:SHS2 domain-containing protein
LSFEYIDDIATADCAVQVEAESLDQVFCDAARALMTRMVDLETVKASTSIEIELEEDSTERLFYDWLSELIFLKDTENMLFSAFEIKELETDHRFRLYATVGGEAIDHQRHEIAIDVKAVTMHMLKVERTGETWTAFVIFDL